MRRRNHNPLLVGPRQPDLFGGETARRQFVFLEDMTEEGILEVPFSAFTPDEVRALPLAVTLRAISRDEVKRRDLSREMWEALSQQEQQAVRANDDPERERRIEKLVERFVEAYRSASDPDWAEVEAREPEEDLDSFLREESDHLVEYVRKRGGSDKEGLDRVAGVIEGMGFTEDEAHRFIDQAMQDADHYGMSKSDESSRPFYKTSVNTGSIYFEYDHYADVIAGMSDDEIEDAVEEINRSTDDVYESRHRGKTLSVANLRDPHFTVERDFEAYTWIDFDPDWDAIELAALELAEEAEPEEEQGQAGPFTWGRRAYSFPDQFYVVELSPAEMEEEGEAMGFCIGQREHGYLDAVEKGQGKAFSLRTARGRPKLTAFVSYKRGEPTKVDQVKGKGNRLPGYNRGDGSLGMDPTEVPDLRPAMQEIFALIAKKDRWASEVIKRTIEASPVQLPLQLPEDAPRKNPARRQKLVSCDVHGSCGEGFCVPYRPSRGRSRH
jgi:hypothetical protein